MHGHADPMPVVESRPKALAARADTGHGPRDGAGVRRAGGSMAGNAA